MSALDKLKEQQASTQLSMSSEQLKQIDETLRVLIATLTSQSDRIKKVEDSQASLMLALNSKSSTSKDSVNDSLTNDVNEIKKTLNAQSETLSALAETVSDKRVVKQSDGSSVSAGELQAHSMMKQLSSDLTKTTSALGELTAQVKAKSHVTLNEQKVADVMSRRVGEHFQKSVQEPVDGLRSDLAGFRDEMGALGSDKLSELRAAVEEVLEDLQRAQQRVKSVERRVTFVGVSRLALAVLPLFASLLLVGGLVWGLGSMFGIGPLFTWAWASFTAASAWWARALIAVATLSGAALFVWVVLRLSRWIYDELR